MYQTRAIISGHFVKQGNTDASGKAWPGAACFDIVHMGERGSALDTVRVNNEDPDNATLIADLKKAHEAQVPVIVMGDFRKFKDAWKFQINGVKKAA